MSRRTTLTACATSTSTTWTATSCASGWNRGRNARRSEAADDPGSGAPGRRSLASALALREGADALAGGGARAERGAVGLGLTGAGARAEIAHDALGRGEPLARRLRDLGGPRGGALLERRGGDDAIHQAHPQRLRSVHGAAGQQKVAAVGAAGDIEQARDAVGGIEAEGHLGQAQA